MASALYSERAEYNERKARILCSSPTGLCEGRCGSLPTQERCCSDQKAVQTRLDPVVDILNIKTMRRILMIFLTQMILTRKDLMNWETVTG